MTSITFVPWHCYKLWFLVVVNIFTIISCNIVNTVTNACCFVSPTLVSWHLHVLHAYLNTMQSTFLMFCGQIHFGFWQKGFLSLYYSIFVDLAFRAVFDRLCNYTFALALSLVSCIICSEYSWTQFNLICWNKHPTCILSANWLKNQTSYDKILFECNFLCLSHCSVQCGLLLVCWTIWVHFD